MVDTKRESLSLKKNWLIIQNNESVLINHNATFPNDIDVLPMMSLFARSFDLGIVAETEYSCAELNENTIVPQQFKAIPLKEALSMIYPHDYGIGVKACSVIHWDKNHQFCGRCGTRTFRVVKHFERACPNCQLSFFPRISPSVIVLIHKNDHVLMARSPHYAKGVYGLIAGFVEIGETIEETIHREIHEEVGLKVKNISYFGSQPWPFPDSLMLAFYAEYQSGDINIDNDEIEYAGWHRYDNLPGRPSTQMSIASSMLDDFIHICSERNKNT